MKWLFAVLSSLLCLALVQGEEWELVYPQNYPAKENLELLSIGCDSEPIPQYMIGSHSGHTLFAIGGSGTFLHWDVLKLPVAFDITAVSGSSGRWVIGGSNGKIALHNPDEDLIQGTFSDGYYTYFPKENWKEDWIQQNWIEVDLGTSEIITDIEDNSAAVIAWAGDTLYVSSDNGITWSSPDFPGTIKDLEEHDGFFYVLVVEGHRLSLLRSNNGIGWTEKWRIDGGFPPYWGSADFMILSENFTIYGDPYKDSNRLYVSIEGYGYGFNDYWHGILSTKDGDTWMDHGSYSNIGGVGMSGQLHRNQRQWNPLKIPDANMDLPAPRWMDDIAGNVGLLEQERILRYVDQEWVDLLATSPGRRLQTDHIAAWDKLTFLYQDLDTNHQLLSINQDGELIEHPLPDIGADDTRWMHWLNIRNQFIGYGYFKFIEEFTRTTEYHFFVTEDFENWTDISRPDYPLFSDLFTTDSELYALRSSDRTFIRWNGDWDGGITWPHGIYKMIYAPGEDAFFAYNQEDNLSRIYKASDDGIFTLFAQYPLSKDDNGSSLFQSLICPDGHRLIVVRNDGWIVLIEPDGCVLEIDLHEYFESPNPDISNICYANGWYFICGRQTLKTRDFVDFSLIDSPKDEPLQTIVGFSGDLYAFTDGAVYRLPMERGYLDSFAMEPGWYHADWLGWFQIIDEELGDIDHLLLGKCWVKQTSELEYWIRTEPLGWIYLRKDWSPWFKRMEDDHWYWLDHDSWPGRAWDYDDQEWEEL